MFTCAGKTSNNAINYESKFSKFLLFGKFQNKKIIRVNFANKRENFCVKQTTLAKMLALQLFKYDTTVLIYM